MIRSSLVLAALVLVACGDDTNPTGGNGGGGQAPQGGGGGVDGGNGGNGGDGGAGANGGAGGEAPVGGEGGGTIGKPCGGLAAVPCAADEFCDYPLDDCGVDDGQGECAPRPVDCPNLDEPTCGCDGTIHGNACDANAAGFDVSVDGCEPPAGDFACGSGFCALASDACFQTPNDVPDPPPVYYNCGDLPPACDQVAVPTCVCAQSLAVSCGGSCEDAAGGGVIIHCPGG